MAQFSIELSKDSIGQKTTATPKTEAASSEWTTPVHLSGSDIGYSVEENAFGVRSTQKKFRDSFAAGVLDTSKWQIVQTGSGQAISQSSGVLSITSGTTVNAETILLSKETFTVPFRAMFGYMMSQRIANTEVYLELVSFNESTGAADDQFGAGWRLEGTSATTGRYQVWSGGLSRLDTTGTIATSASYSIKEIECFTDETWFHDRAMDSTAGRTASWVRHQQIPDPNRLYKIRIRVKNLGTAPASSTTLSLQYITVVDYAELTTEITASRGAASAGMGMPVILAGGSSSVSGTVNTNLIANNGVGPVTKTNLAASATYTASTLDTGSTIGYNSYRVIVAHTAGLTPGHLVYEQSDDNFTGTRETHRIPIPSDGLYRTFEFPINARYVRAKFINGVTAQTLMYLNTTYTRIDGSFDSDKTLSFTHSTTPLAASATFTGTTMDLGANHSINRHRAMVYATTAGTLYLEQSRDGTNWRPTTTATNTAGQSLTVDDFIVSRYVRIRYVNGATADTGFDLQSALVKN